ncbi:uncharacterized protein LOC114576256 [Exaiptasia diaphana]|uniref:Uncharacterized protein n=1 Tax=Exaiptasia diaphana TaxID=2652724 RepID=A0A913YS77_EXADI|nr:uncharacterized protein LOC114576256 [Exaiptasia diaphana]
MTPHRRNSVPNQAATTNITMDNRERTGKIAKPSQSQEERRLAMGTRLSISRCTVSSMAKEEFPYPVNKNKALNQGIKFVIVNCRVAKLRSSRVTSASSLYRK